ncbi:hypothetical protein NDU88_006086 [Pleurodeles waltl]|uniref:Uncharacterized protein n=1 Tax=Pleurodeles waltl TaxID=8319 RepID=A0AAV7TE38_PLEWA|nr:hypothetical protein NDU88_006086 [Pleurodeles waltl]
MYAGVVVSGGTVSCGSAGMMPGDSKPTILTWVLSLAPVLKPGGDRSPPDGPLIRPPDTVVPAVPNHRHSLEKSQSYLATEVAWPAQKSLPLY